MIDCLDRHVEGRSGETRSAAALRARTMAAPSLLAQIASGAPVDAPVAVVVAHPDDETIGLGAQLGRFDDALLVHVTDGTPRDGEDARNYGFAGVADYAAARAAELCAALRAGDASRLRRLAPLQVAG